MKLPIRTTIHNFLWRDYYAQIERLPPQETNQSVIVSVTGIGNQVRTAPIAALLGLLINFESTTPVVLLDADTINQPLRKLLKVNAGGDLLGLANHKTKGFTRTELESYAALDGTIPLLTATPDTTNELSAQTLESAIHSAQHRWPTIIINLSPDCPKTTIAAGLALSNHAFYIAPPKLNRYDWPHVHNATLEKKLANNLATILLTSKNSGVDVPNTIYLPHADYYFSLQEELKVLDDPHSLTQFRRMLNRIYPRGTSNA